MHVCASETLPYSVCACCDCFGVEGDAVFFIYRRESEAGEGGRES